MYIQYALNNQTNPIKAALSWRLKSIPIYPSYIKLPTCMDFQGITTIPELGFLFFFILFEVN